MDAKKRVKNHIVDFLVFLRIAKTRKNVFLICMEAQDDVIFIRVVNLKF